MDRNTFEQTAARLRPLILRIGREFFGSADDAEDVAQDALVQLWRYCERLDEGRNVEALAVRVAKNCCVNMKRRQRLQVVRGEEHLPATTPLPSPSPLEVLEWQERVSALDEAVGLLQPRERQLFEMRQMEGLSTEEIAQQTGMAKATVQSMIAMARRKLFNNMKGRKEL
ncbi:MAG: sigma-70 family RNA polymerase sigma factor [Prevotella sp.]|nr:sigma-70 family RNA polymerase sigma factor [Prevotella sp.]MDE6646927.1 sigma-70 family RNA polymerase sigma factor [Prevotella sp.]